MGIISVTPLENRTFRVCLVNPMGLTENVIIVCDSGIYSLYWKKNNIEYNQNGKIINVVTGTKNDYILFDYSDNLVANREQISFSQIMYIKDITPNNAYTIAVDHGFIGTEVEWLESLRGYNGKSAYDIAVAQGYKGSEAEWIASLKGYDGKSAYQLAVEHGYKGTEAEWIASLGDTTQVRADIQSLYSAITWVKGMGTLLQ